MKNTSTYLIFDKYALSHSFTNALTSNITLDNVFNNTYEHIYGKDALETYNKMFDLYKIPNIDEKLYCIHIFSKNTVYYYILTYSLKKNL